MSDKIRDEQTDNLFRAVLSLNNNYIYSDISEKTGLSTATISRVNRCLKYGNDGYAEILRRLDRKK